MYKLKVSVRASADATHTPAIRAVPVKVRVMKMRTFDEGWFPTRR